MEDHRNSVAIIGVSGVFPEADSIEQFYHNLKSGHDSVKEVSVNRLHDTSFDPYANYLPMGYMDRVDGFDHKFFNLSKREAELMNPEQRLILQLSCRAIENAGYSLQSFQGSNTAVYLGGGNASNYASLIQEFEPTALTGNMNAVTAGRVAYFLNLNGPAMMIDTSCSSSLVAMHEACQKVVSGQVDYALAGGVYIIINFPDISEATGEIGIMSVDGRSKSFAAGANGTGGGEGGGVVLLKRLDKALADKDLIHAVIRGGAINHDGSRSAGLTAPSVKAQTEVIKQAWQNAGVLPETISFVEAHGTGTKLGDPIEFEALTEAFRQYTGKKKFCALGSVKTNVGHLNNAAGLAGVVKSVLSLKHQELFPSLHFLKPNPFIDVENTALQVNTQLQKWERNGTLLRCGVSSFGLSGTNAHLILEEAPAQPALSDTLIEKDFILKISAKTPEALRSYIRSISDYLAGSEEQLSDSLYTLNHGRDEYAFRLCLTGASKETLLQALSSRYTTFDTHTYGPIREDQKVFTVLLFSDDRVEEQTIEQLSAHYPLFQQHFEHVTSLGNKQSASLRTFAFQYALYRQWQEMGIQAKTIIGTGIGRLTKQVVVDGLALEQAVTTLEKTAELSENTSVKPDEEKLKKVVKMLEQAGKTVFLEMGQSGILSQSIEGLLDKTAGSSVATLLVPDFGGSLLGKVADLYQQGIRIDWNIFYAQTNCRKVEAPTYPFEQIRCWVENQPRATPAKTNVEDWLYDLRWE
ncbi:MAG: beta-ketoacyl synthase N-terminal-like domain-containing protein, partial [Bacteroidota bacterium]